LQAEGEGVVTKVFSVGPLAKLATFTGLSRVFSFLRGAAPVQVTAAPLVKKCPVPMEQKVQSSLKTNPWIIFLASLILSINSVIFLED
jgi:hypothetical protein